MRKISVAVGFLLSSFVWAQTGGININVYDNFSNRPISAKIRILNVEKTYEGQGEVSIDSLPTKTYDFLISAEEYEDRYLSDISILPNQKLNYSIGLRKQSSAVAEISEVVITRRGYKSTRESPVSLRSISSEEVQKNAGSNRDVAKTFLSLPGVASTSTFRNDLLIRGGASMENKFYIDGIEVPTINHFQTQGASGGPRGIITVDFIKDVDFYSGAFPARRNGVMSSLFEFNFKEARKDKMGYKAVLGIDDMQFMMDGPLSKDQSWTGLFSVRKSNLQLLFKAIGLPFLPSYYDGQFKVSKKFKSGDELYFLGIGAIDRFKLNLDAEKTPSNWAILDRVPVAPQWNYTIGAGYRHLVDNGNWLFTLSQNRLDNRSTKYFKNNEQPQNLLLDYHSKELENKLRIDRNWKWGDYKWSAGANAGLSHYSNDTYSQSITAADVVADLYNANLDFFQYGLYFQVSQQYFDNRLVASLGARVDASTYSDLTNNPLDQFSPRLSLQYKLNPTWAINFNSGIYYQLPPYTALGFNEAGSYVNKNTLKYIRNSQVVLGVEYNGENNFRVTLEGYYKRYGQYPYSLRNGISLANVATGFGVVGVEPLNSSSKGETYGIEFLAQKRTSNDFYGILSYTYGFSKFSDATGSLLPSAWDTRHIAAITAGKYFKKNWNIGARFRLQSGYPETPYDLNRSSLVTIWNVANGPVQDYSLLNTGRGKLVNQLDVRVEKKWIFSKWQLTAYLDVVNMYGSNNPSNLPVIGIERDANGNGVIMNPTAPLNEQRYSLTQDPQESQTTLPYIGLIFEF